MRVNRESLLRTFESVSPGLASKELLEQSSCLVFTEEGKVATFNDEICCFQDSPLNGFVGAVKAKPVMDLLDKLDEDDIEIEQDDENLIVKGKRRKAKIRMESEVLLPVESVESPGEWKELDPEFGDAVKIVSKCASTEESRFVLTCIHIHPEFLESCDCFQIARYPLDTKVEESFVARAESLSKIVGLGMTEFSLSSSWLHFRNKTGLVISCRRWNEDFDEFAGLDRFLVSEGVESVTLPANIEDVVARSEIFSSENAEGNHVVIDLRSDRLVIEGVGAIGWYKEMKKIAYSGKQVRFLINPKLLVEISRKSNSCGVGEGRIFIDTGKFKYAASTIVPEDKETDDDDES